MTKNLSHIDLSHIDLIYIDLIYIDLSHIDHLELHGNLLELKDNITKILYCSVNSELTCDQW